MPVGTCHICYRNRELTFEHIPPRSAYNRGRVTSIDVEEWLHQDSLDYSDGRVQQRGMGFQVLCGECNAFLGREYVLEYRDWAKVGVQVLAAAPANAQQVALTLYRRKPLRFLKQCAAMLAAVHDPPFLNIHPGLRKFVLDPEERRLPGLLDFYLTLFRGNRARSVAHAQWLEWRTGQTLVVAEVAFNPFAVLLKIDAPRRQAMGRITGLTRFGPDEVTDVRLTLRIGDGVTPFPGDYRTRDQVERDAQNSRSHHREAE